MGDRPTCFVAMPSGGVDPDAHAKWAGWYKHVIEPAAEAAGCTPFLSVQSDAPVSITREILEHLVADPVAVFDLGSLVADGVPNANVMYELGVRHAFHKPSAVIGSKASTIPFDVHNQRAIVVGHDLGGVSEARQRLANAIEHALAGEFYNPFEGLERARLIEKAASSDETLRAINAELKDVRHRLDRMAYRSQLREVAIDESAPIRRGGRTEALERQKWISVSDVGGLAANSGYEWPPQDEGENT